jgi:hypothetical protein
LIADSRNHPRVLDQQYQLLGITDPGYNEVDTAGQGLWGGSYYQQSRVGLGGNPVVEPQDLPLLTADEYYLPLKLQPVKANGDPYFGTSDEPVPTTALSTMI